MQLLKAYGWFRGLRDGPPKALSGGRSGVTRVQMKPGQLPNSKLLINMIIFIWHLTYLVDLDGAFIYSKVANWQLF